MRSNNLREKLESKLQEKISQLDTHTVNENNQEIYVPDVQSPVDLKTSEFALTISEAKSRVELLQSFIHEMMTINVDYGLIPGTPKPTLFKSGAEKLCSIYGFAISINITSRLEDFENKLFHYEAKATLTNKRTGTIEAEGIGSCNNKERKFINQDPFSIMNTILKMAKKRALIDAVLSATRTSGIFTQDLDDLMQDTSVPDSKTKGTPKSESGTLSKVTKGQMNEIVSIMESKKISIDTAKTMISERYHIKESKQLTKSQAQDFINHLKMHKAS